MKLKAISIALATLMATGGAFATQPPPPQSVTVTNTTANPVPVSGNVGISGTPSVNVANTPSVTLSGTPTVNVGNSTKPSQLVHASTFAGGVCPFNSAGYQIPVDIPTGMVLVINHVSVFFNSGPSHAGLFAGITLQTTSDTIAGQWVGILDANGITAHDFYFPTGIVVRSAEAFCVATDVNFGSVVAPSHLYGYLAKDE